MSETTIVLNDNERSKKELLLEILNELRGILACQNETVFLLRELIKTQQVQPPYPPFHTYPYFPPLITYATCKSGGTDDKPISST